MPETVLPRLPLRSNLHHLALPAMAALPVSVYTVGTEQQSAITRLKGFSASQLHLTFFGSGQFRPLGRAEWDIVLPASLLYIPAGMPHEYVRSGQEPWQVGYVTFVENQEGAMRGWGFDKAPYQKRLANTGRLFELLAEIWSCSGSGYDAWQSTERLFAFCVELNKQIGPGPQRSIDSSGTFKPLRSRNGIVDGAVRFLHDHLHRELTLTTLASHLGYSSKQVNRLFLQEIGVTPMQYLQRVRLKTAALLLSEHPGLTVRQVAAHIGMEPDYMARLFRRVYGRTPSEWRENKRGTDTKGGGQ